MERWVARGGGGFTLFFLLGKKMISIIRGKNLKIRQLCFTMQSPNGMTRCIFNFVLYFRRLRNYGAMRMQC